MSSLCIHELKKTILQPLGDVDFGPLPTFNYLKKHIYEPLGYKFIKKYTYPEVFDDLVFLNDDASMIHPEMHLPSNKEFFNMIVNSLMTLKTMHQISRQISQIFLNRLLIFLKNFIFFGMYIDRDIK